jgi:gas vesicle structural protein
MAISTPSSRPSGGGLAEVVELILDRGLVIDIWARVSLVGIELLTIEARIVVASIDTYLRYAEAVRRLNLEPGRQLGAPDLIAGTKTEKAIEAATDQLDEPFGGLGQPAEHKARRAAPPDLLDAPATVPKGARHATRRPSPRTSRPVPRGDER